ncbi:MAG: hypothetical protein A2Z95_06050 [Gallionellales bacterium GWA2_60_18]|nr:MAG: hypothetical protein A2Z95_06050 [Gallionellales bacterium GWA2_60_18]
MSRLMNPDQHRQLLLLRTNLAASVLAGDASDTQHRLGMVQGYLIGLHAADEIDFGDLQALENDITQGMAFLVNARKGSRAN